MRIVIVEDQERQRKGLQVDLSTHYASRGGYTFEVIATEEEFYEWHDRLAADNNRPLPDIVIFDIMLPCRPLRPEDFVPGAPPPPNKGPMNEAGFRCAERLRGAPQTSRVPFLFYTALPPDLVRAGLEKFPGVPHKRKDNNPAALIEQIETVLAAARSEGGA